MRAEIIAVGSELLSPHFTDTNSAYITARLEEIGVEVAFRTIVGDVAADLADAVEHALRRCGLVLVMGGLGPTEDDLTRETCARVLGRELDFEPGIKEAIELRFRRRGRPMPGTNLKQCFVIRGAEVLPNDKGTAPGLWIESGGARLALLPGPPAELIAMFEASILPRLRPLAGGRLTVRRTIRLTGLGESAMEEKIKGVYSGLPPGLTVTTLAKPSDLAVIISCTDAAPREAIERKLDDWAERFISLLRPYVYSTTGEDLETVVARLLVSAGKTLACAESCTGGLLGSRLTDVPGSSAFFLESAVTYSNEAKVSRLGVPRSLIAKKGAVSAEVARAMARGVRSRSGADFGLAVTGIAGPGGARPRKPVGLTYIALAGARSVTVKRHLFWGGRGQVKFQATQAALDLLRKKLLNKKVVKRPA
jgi:nicotinamide-nucleotide amidase